MLTDPLDANGESSGENNQCVDFSTQTDPIGIGSLVADHIENLEKTIQGLKEDLKKQLQNNEALKALIKEQRLKFEMDITEARSEADQMQQYKKQCLCVENCTDSDQNKRFFTGFQKHETFQYVFKYFEPLASNMRYWEGRNIESQRNEPQLDDKRAKKSKIDLNNQFFITMCRVSRGFSVKELAFFFGVSVSTISRIIITWLRLIDTELPNLFPPVSLPNVISSNPPDIRAKYPRLYGILDCTEFYIETPSSIQAQSACFSQYKHYTTYKVLYLTAVNGAILYVSPVYSGRCTDKQIVLDSRVLNTIPANSQILADRGFEIERECMLSDVELIIPPFKGTRPQLSEEEVWNTEVIANSRIHVERAIRRVKTFHIFDNDLPLSMSATMPMIIRIVSYFQNFLDPNIK